LVLTQPDIIEAIHTQYFEAGCDIVETNTFNGTTISQADYHLEHLVSEMNRCAAQVAKRAAAKVEAAANDGRRRLVAGAVGPTSRTLSVSPSVEDPGFRNVSTHIYPHCFVSLSNMFFHLMIDSMQPLTN
jgi:5-methyltetrahydrofolate--homocysteine methyltransferase